MCGGPEREGLSGQNAVRWRRSTSRALQKVMATLYKIEIHQGSRLDRILAQRKVLLLLALLLRLERLLRLRQL